MQFLLIMNNLKNATHAQRTTLTDFVEVEREVPGSEQLRRAFRKLVQSLEYGEASVLPGATRSGVRLNQK